MLKSEKEEIIKELNQKFSKVKSAVLAEFSKVNVETVTRLRRKFREGKVEYRVLKNTLAKRAAKGTPLEVLSEEFSGPVALALSYDDVIAPAKILSEFIKDMGTIKVRGAVVEGNRVDAKGVQALAKLPGLKELRGKILGMLNLPAAKLARTLAAPGAQLARVLKAREEALAKK